MAGGLAREIILRKCSSPFLNTWLFEGYDDSNSAILASVLLQLEEHKRFGPKVRDNVDGCARLGQTQEYMLLETFVAQAAIERFHEGALHRLTRRDVVPVQPPDRPASYRRTGQLAAVVRYR